MSRTLILSLVLAAAATTAQAQAWSPRPGAPAVDPHRYEVEQNRAATDRLRLQADQRELEARRQQLDTRLTRLGIEARRQPDLAPPPAYRALRSPEEERAWRESETQRRQATQAGVGQIDAWLDRKQD
ncbi:MAG: hypothetical protein EON89_04390 [Brevundimonas sp.]|nr:MAG: hypothetical protein EON89_04390 [Brevundimonas sp.]